MTNCAAHYPTAMAGLHTSAEFFGVTKLENLDPMVARDKSPGELFVDGITSAAGLSTALAPGTKVLAEHLSERLVAEVGPRAAQAGLSSVGPMIETLTKERGYGVVTKLEAQFERLGTNVAVREAVADTLKGLVAKSVPDEVAKKAIEAVIDKAAEGAERHVREGGVDVAYDCKVHPTYGRSESGKIVGVYPSEKNPALVVMHTTDDRYVKVMAEEYGGDAGVGTPRVGSIVTLGGGKATDVVGRANGEIVRANADSGKAMPSVRDVELFESQHPPRGLGGTAIVVDDAVFIHKGRGEYLLAEKNDIGLRGVKTGDVVDFDAHGHASVEQVDRGHAQAATVGR